VDQQHHAAADVPLEAISIRAIGQDGKVAWRGKCHIEPDAAFAKPSATGRTPWCGQILTPDSCLACHGVHRGCYHRPRPLGVSYLP